MKKPTPKANVLRRHKSAYLYSYYQGSSLRYVIVQAGRAALTIAKGAA